MGQITVERVIEILGEGGIRSATAFPAQQITRVTAPIAAVSLEEMDQENERVTVLVEILGPKEKGGFACQKKAVEACQVLAAAGAVCKQGSCSFLNKSNLFRVQIRVTFPVRERIEIRAGQWVLSHACGFSSVQRKTAEAESLQGMPWEITVEEFFPWGVQDTLEQEEPFHLEIRCKGNVERYSHCRWQDRQRQMEKTGIRQIRKATAQEMLQTSE